MTPLLELKDIRRSYPAGDEQVEVLKGISLDIYAGEMVAIVGASGSGKSTLMNILGCLDKATSGTYRVAGQDVATLDADALAQLRREHFGFIFQRYFSRKTVLWRVASRKLILLNRQSKKLFKSSMA